MIPFRRRRGRWLLDMTDFVNYALWVETPIGIQRVAFEAATRLVRRHAMVCFSTYDGEFWDMTRLVARPGLPIEALVAAARARHPTRIGTRLRLPALHRLRQRLRRRRPPDPRAGDGVLVLGAWWEMPTAYERCRRARAEGLPVVTLVYDLIPALHREMTGHDYSEAFARLLRIPTHVLSISRHTEREFAAAQSAGIVARPLDIRVVPLAHELPGVPRNDRAAGLPPALAARIAGPFVLCVGTVEVRKNHAALLDAWERLRARRGALPLLVVAGKRGWKAEGVLARLAAQPGVVFVEGPGDAALRSLYANCLFTVFPSLFEGWGLPVGESLWFGKACAASRATTLPEVGGDLCTYFDPEDRDAIAAAIERLLDDDVRAAAEARIRRAPLRSWSDVGAEIAALVDAVPRPAGPP